MRDLFKKAMTGSMIAGAALLVVACGGAGSEANNTATTEMDAGDMGTTNDVTAIDGANAMDANMTMDANMSMDANASANTVDANVTTNTADTSGNMTNGM